VGWTFWRKSSAGIRANCVYEDFIRQEQYSVSLRAGGIDFRRLTTAMKQMMETFLKMPSSEKSSGKAPPRSNAAETRETWGGVSFCNEIVGAGAVRRIATFSALRCSILRNPPDPTGRASPGADPRSQGRAMRPLGETLATEIGIPPRHSWSRRQHRHRSPTGSAPMARARRRLAGAEIAMAARKIQGEGADDSRAYKLEVMRMT